MQLSVAVVGAAYPNKDGSNRRSAIAFLNRGDLLDLRPEPKNPHDEHAIAVHTPDGFQIGYIASARAVFLGKLMREGRELIVLFQDVASWGAIARVGVDCEPYLPPESRSDEISLGEADDDPGFWPDPTYDD